MADDSPPTSRVHTAKRQRQASFDGDDSPPSIASAAGGGPSPISDSAPNFEKIGQSSNFRSVSACTRCRHRKNRCDQRLPRCASCEKVGVACTGYDPITKKEIPRSYVFYLESRIKQLEALLDKNHLAFPPAENLECSSLPMQSTPPSQNPAGVRPTPTDCQDAAQRETASGQHQLGASKFSSSRAAMLEHPETSNPKYLGSTTGISFAKVVHAAVQSSVPGQKLVGEAGGTSPFDKPVESGTTSMRDSFFGLHTKPTIQPAAFPEKELGLKLAGLYFEYANPQIPILHKHIFMRTFEQAYTAENRVRGPKELYMLNMVFAIGSGVFVGDAAKHATGEVVGERYYEPEEYHASAIVHLEACLNGSDAGVEVLQAVLLLAKFALIKSVPPGLWYIIGVAVRLAVDLGLYHEDGEDITLGLKDDVSESTIKLNRERGRREFVRDMRRRLWWCTYSLDRLVSICVGRPCGFSDQVITTDFPSLLDDRHITSTGFAKPPPLPSEPSYKRVAHHYFRLRLLQSEILQVLQYQQAQLSQASGNSKHNPFMHSNLTSPFLAKFDSFRSWRMDIDKKLWAWKNSAPTRQETGVAFSTDFLDLNYWQAVILLYRQSLSIPAVFEGEYDTSSELNSSSTHRVELVDEDRVYLKVAEAGQKIIRIYKQQHLQGLVNYTYYATHSIFTAGVSYLYAIWHSPVVRSRLSMEEVGFTIFAAVSVFADLIERCPPAEACRDAFDRMAKTTIKMANAKGGFGPLGSQSVSQAQPATSSSHQQRTHQRSKTERSSHSSSVSRAASDTFAPPHTHYQALKSDPEAYSALHNATMAAASSASRSNAGSFDAGTAVSFQLSPQSISPADAPQYSQPLPSLTTRSVATGNYLTQRQQHHQPPVMGAGSGFADLQSMDWLQDLGTSPRAVAPMGNALSGDGMEADSQIDFGFGLNWPGAYHDFSGGQNFDIFNGYFFGGQQPGSTGGGSGLGDM